MSITGMINDNGLTTIEKVREEFGEFYMDVSIFMKVKLKCWINHSESRDRNGNQPYTFENYIQHMNTFDYIQQINLNIINVHDLGEKDAVVALLLDRYL